MLKNETQHKIKNTVIFVLIGLLVIAVAGAAFAFSKVDKVDLGTNSYQIATINEDGGIDKANKSALVSNFVDVEGLEIEVVENSKASYVVHYYDENKEYISSTDALEVDLTIEAPDDAEYARIEIVPTDDNYISIFEKGEYASQLKVSLAK